MGKSINRPGQKEIEEQKRKKLEAQKNLRERAKTQGLVIKPKTTTPNRKCEYETTEEERCARNDAVIEQLKVYRIMLPILLKKFKEIPDYRNPKKIKHKLTVLLIYGILTFVLHISSRREANREITRPVFMKNLQLLFPELESIPHNDTLKRLLAGIDVGRIENALADMVRRLIRKKKFKQFLIDNCYPIAIDGSQKFVRDHLWDEECLERTIKRKKEKEARPQYYVYILEASLSFHGGMVIPVLSEFLSYTKGDTEQKIQDCELKAFERLADRLKKEFPGLRIMVLLDGLYANGPVIEICKKKKWQFMIVLKSKSLKSVWEEYEGLKKLLPGNKLEMKWGNRIQRFYWVNDIDYYYGSSGRKKHVLHIVVCEEEWEEVDNVTGETVPCESRHAWISSKSLGMWNIHERCNLGARYRWGIEESFLVEKRHGYNYEHCFSYNWKAMKGYHYLMRIGHAINVLAQYSDRLAEYIKEKGVRGFIRFIRDTISGPWLDKTVIKERLADNFQLRLL
ncbi:MAG: transposase family protein [bacterium]|nr:transposase family protein [bacterium]